MSMRIQTFETILIFTDKLTEEEYIYQTNKYKDILAGDYLVQKLNQID